MDNLTINEAYEAMYCFLESLYDSTKSDELGSMLGNMSYLGDGKVADPAVWDDWVKAVKKVKSGEANLSLGIK